MTTNASVDEIVNVLKGKYKINVKQQQFKVVIITLNNGEQIEIAPYRVDKYDKDGNRKHVTIKVAKTLKEDIVRRDATINALAYDPVNKKLIDLCNGVKDLNNKILKSFKDPNKTILEDPIRIFRYIKYMCKLNLKLDSKLEKAIVDNRELLKDVPYMKKGVEFQKCFMIDPYKTIKLFDKYNVLEYIIPELVESKEYDGGKYHNESVFDHLILSMKNTKSKKFYLMLAILLLDIGKI